MTSETQLEDIDIDFGGSSLFTGAPEADIETIEEENLLHNFNPISKPSLKINLSNGKTIRIQQKNQTTQHIPETDAFQDSYMDMDLLMKKAELRNKIKENDAKVSAMKPIKEASDHSQIWTEKYRPTKFVQLCSAGNDKQYRAISLWLKQWSSIVFKEEINEADHIDALGRPHHKILLVHGPTGIGKTSAVHIIAKQLGYSIQELNAANSMDTLRQSQNGNPSLALKLRIKNALTSNSIDTKNKDKPSCLVIDEIDSFANASDVVKTLNDLIYSDQKAYNKKLRKESTDQTKNKKDMLLNRPIICIANDIYAQNPGRFGPNPMDKLRSISHQVQFKKPMTSTTTTGAKLSGNAIKSVKDHLMYINDREKLNFTFQELGDIIEICEGDIRAAINHIQFQGRKVYNEKNNPKKFDHLMDSQVSWFSMVDQLYKREPQLSKEENFIKLFDKYMNGDGKAITSSTTSFDKVMKGVFNKYLDVVYYQDDSLKNPCELSDWLNYYDQFSNFNHMDMSQYYPIAGLKFWSLLAEIKPNKSQSLILNAKNIEYETNEALKSNKNIVKLVVQNLPIDAQLALGNTNYQNMSCQFLPHLSKMMLPSMSSKVKSNLNDFEKSKLEQITRLVKDFNISLEHSKDFETGAITLKMNPNWDSIVNYESPLASTSIASLSKQVQLKRQTLFPLITAELERLEMMRKSSNVKRPIEEEAQVKVKKSKPNGSSIDFFKNKYQEVLEKNSKPQHECKISRIWVKYNEGFSNAVRKNITWNDIWSL